MRNKYSFFTLFLIGLIINFIKALLFAFALNFVGKILYRVLHEDFLPLLKRVLVSPELYQDTLILTVIMVVLSLPEVYFLAKEYYNSEENLP